MRVLIEIPHLIIIYCFGFVLVKTHFSECKSKTTVSGVVQVCCSP